MNWSQKLLLVRLVALAGFVLSIGGCGVGMSKDSAVVAIVATILAMVFLVLALAANLVARVVFHWHKAGAVGKGHRVWHD
jgi:hypothetical protein